MGNESSLLKNRTISPSDGSVSLRIRNNYHPLQFHQVHGENIKLMKGRSIACRHEGFCKGIVFSDRPVLIYERIYIKFVDISSNWSGALRIGFTMHDPVTLKSKLPRYACPDLTSMQGNWAKAIAERMAKKDSVLYYYVDQGGDVHYGIDSEEHGIFFGGVNTSGKLWAVLDIYGNTLAIEFIEPNLLNQDNSNELENNLISLPVNNEIQRIPSEYVIPRSAFRFHHVHGKNALLSVTRYIAAKKAGTSSLAYVFTEHPLKINQKVEIKILDVDQHCTGSMFYGITSCDPSTILPSSLPVNTDDLLDRPEYWVVREDTSSYKIGHNIHFSINEEGEAVVTKNNQKSAVFHVDPSQPLWLFLNLTGLISEVYFSGLVSSEEAELLRLMENCTISASAPTSSTSTEEAEMIRQIEKLSVPTPGPSSQQTFTECVICYEEPVNCALYRCGHICMCYKCACQMWKPRSKVQCPICRETIQDVIKIYI